MTGVASFTPPRVFQCREIRFLGPPFVFDWVSHERQDALYRAEVPYSVFISNVHGYAMPPSNSQSSTVQVPEVASDPSLIDTRGFDQG